MIQYLDMKILLTGAKGQLGQEISALSEQMGIALIPCSRSDLDITDEEAVYASLLKHRPSIVINPAAYTSADLAESEPEKTSLANTKGPENLAKVCQKLGIALIHISTDYIFDGNSSKPYVETDKAAPLNVYGETKWLGEEAVRANLEQHIILRVGWIFSKFSKNFVKSILHLMLFNEELRVVKDQNSCPTYAKSIAHAVLTMAARPVWGTYHFSDQPSTSRYDYAVTIFEEAKDLFPLRVKKIIPITTKEFPTPAKRPARTVLDCTKFTDIYGIKLCDWREGLKETLLAIKEEQAYTLPDPS